MRVTRVLIAVVVGLLLVVAAGLFVSSGRAAQPALDLLPDADAGLEVRPVPAALTGLDAVALDEPAGEWLPPGATAEWWDAVRRSLASGGARSIGDGIADWTLTGEGANNNFGYSVATAGDVNGDGYADVVVGALRYYNYQGRVYIYAGGAAGLSTTPIFTATGEYMSNYYGHSVATAGDVNGDGYADIVVGAYRYSSLRGRAYVYAGGAGGLSATPIFTATGEGTDNEFGYSVATAGDVNDDGYADLIVGAYRHNSYQGRAYVYAGGASGLSATPVLTLSGEATGNRFGISVATAGDVNGDGYADIVVGARGYNSNQGRVHVYGGGTGGLSATPIFTADGEGTNNNFGESVATAGDVNGDGYADVIVGANRYNSYQGRAYVYLGGSGSISATPIFTATGEATSDYFGFSVATAGDVNGDGYADVVVGANGYSSIQGQAYVYGGGLGGISTTPIFTASGEATSNYFGVSVATAGDVNGDGYAEVIVGASGFNSGQGRAYVFAGEAGGLSATPIFTATGDVNDALGSWVATAGDVNGDGYADVVVGASWYNSNQGRAYVYAGGEDGLSATPILTATGEATGHNFGSSVGPAGDVNGDGYADVVVGASSYPSERGRVYVYAGGAAGLSATPVFTATGESTSYFFGCSVGTAGDVNGDGYADIVVGAYRYNSWQGRAYVYAGGPGGLSATPIFTATGENTSDDFGFSVATAGDVNGDGYADVVVGARRYGSYGRAYVYAGGPGGLLPTPVFTATGESTSEEFGHSVAAAGDVNGDGYGDIVVGAYDYNDHQGRVYVYAGGAGGVSATPTFTATGEVTRTDFGGAVATAGDVNGDGYADIVVGAGRYNSDRGRFYVYAGGALGVSATPVFTATGEADYDFFGWRSVATAGDVNGDGYADLAVGSHNYGAAQGRVYVFGGNGGNGRIVLPRQARSVPSLSPRIGGSTQNSIIGGSRFIQPWGVSRHISRAFYVHMYATDPMGRGRVKLQVEACPSGVPFGDGTCTLHTSQNWTDVTTSIHGVLLTELLSGLSYDTLYRWRARVLYAPYGVTAGGITPPPNPAHGPWRRLYGQSLEADVRIKPYRLWMPLVLRNH